MAWSYDRGWWPEPIFLVCGDETKGIIHIDRDHLIAEDGSDDVTMPKCFENVMYYGEDYPAPPGNQALKVTLSDGQDAIVAWDKASRRVLTVYTTGEKSNDWDSCAGNVPWRSRIL